jgi:hypothetical protein
MFQPCSVWVQKPSQDSSSICSTYHSAMACLTRRVRIGVARLADRPPRRCPVTAPAGSGSSAASSATPHCSSSYSTLVPK